MTLKLYKDESRKNYGSDTDLVLEQINTGCLQRIADAVEKMATNHIELQRSRDLYERRYNEEVRACERLAKSNAALRGIIKKRKAGA